MPVIFAADKLRWNNSAAVIRTAVFNYYIKRSSICKRTCRHITRLSASRINPSLRTHHDCCCSCCKLRRRNRCMRLLILQLLLLLLLQVLHGPGRWSIGLLMGMQDAVATGCCCSCAPHAERQTLIARCGLLFWRRKSTMSSVRCNPSGSRQRSDTNDGLD